MFKRLQIWYFSNLCIKRDWPDALSNELIPKKYDILSCFKNEILTISKMWKKNKIFKHFQTPLVTAKLI